MKSILTYAIYFAFGALVANMALANTVIVDDKAYTLVEIDGQLLVSNEWQPVSESGYTDEYLQSEQYQTVKAANESLRRIKQQ
ncbi:hypothetical protein BTW00_05530 [Psychrobacter sp. C 20.9]|uniref:hypothetical protein n=1 Tax=Psychrobacter sp. C 20.9 TaxID=1926477 RepID=UPI0009472469|nr:hypothetical protein [Psychrobacter sp. C 20.9]OLF36546.1 hypothetical protein BTW00_05530 [Psychrobacter sp. C 20.9]